MQVSTSFLLRPISCPPGFHLHSQMHSCECEHQQDILDCDRAAMKFVLLNVSADHRVEVNCFMISLFLLSFQDGLWGGPRSWSRTLVTYPCPPQYCNCTGSPNDNTIEGCALIYSNPSLSCTANRAGRLCMYLVALLHSLNFYVSLFHNGTHRVVKQSVLFICLSLSMNM